MIEGDSSNAVLCDSNPQRGLHCYAQIRSMEKETTKEAEFISKPGAGIEGGREGFGNPM